MRLSFDGENSEALLSELVQPRPDWFAMDRIAGLLPSLVAAFEQISQPIEGADAFLEWLGSGAIEAKFWRLAPIRQGIQGLFGDYPQHAGLQALSGSDCSAKRLQLAAYIIHVAFCWRQELIPSEKAIFERRLEGAWRALRLLSDPALARVPMCIADVERFEKKFARVSEGIDRRAFEEKDVRYLDELQRFFKFYVGEGRIVTFHSERDKSALVKIKKVGEWRSLEIDKDSEVEGGQHKSVHITLPKDSESSRQDHHKAGNAPEELMSESVLLREQGASLKTDLGEEPAAALKKRQPKRAAYRRANNLLPGRWESLNEYERGLVLKRLFEERWGSEDSNIHVLLMLLTGRSPESVSKTLVVQNRSQLPKTFTDPERIYLISEDRAWASCVPEPPERRKLRSEWASHMEVTQRQFTGFIPDPFWRILGPRVDSSARRVRKKSGILFPKGISTDSVVKEIAAVIKDINKETGARITLKRIQTCVFEGLIRQTSDTVDACLVTGRQLPTGQSANAYYHTRTVEVLSADYEEVVKAWLVNLGLSDPSMAPARLDLDLPRLGSPLCLRPDVMKDVVTRLRSQLNEYRKSGPSQNVTRKFHNLFTAYVILQLMWSTGLRAVRDPIAHRYEFNQRRGFVIIADKADDNLGHSRLVYLPDQMIKQLVCYETHRRHLELRLQEVGVDVPIDTFFFFLNVKLQPEFAGPKQLAEEIRWTFPWPLNVSRHTLRGYLRDQGVPGYLVDAFMGHWGVGTEPMAKYSSIDPNDMKNWIVPATTALLEKLGFEFEAGFDA